MHKKYDNESIEQKWQHAWEESGIYAVGDRDPAKEKEYVLVEWPYPSGNLHIGHWYAFAVPDIYTRFQSMQGKQVLFPMGFDAFGLPAENAAIKRGIDPKKWTYENIDHMRNQLRSMGNMFSWDKTTSSTDPDYYRWTQWMFTEFFKHGIAYRGTGLVNWCPSCQTVIANEQVSHAGECERCGTAVEKREMPQWMFGITQYADRLVDDLDTLDWPEHIKEAQRRWIGRSEGAHITFTLSTGDAVEVFTTRPDTLYGATYMVLAPEHALITKNKDRIHNWDEVDAYIAASGKKAEQERLDETKEKTGVRLDGIMAVNPATEEEIPVYVADYVLAAYGTGAIMAVPAHDERDHAFAAKYNIPMRQVIAPYVELTGTDAPRSDENIFHFTAATAVVKHWSEEKYYVVDFGNDLRGFVGGSMHEGETPVETAKRETTEESGYTDIATATFVAHQVNRGYKSRKQREEICQDHGVVVELASDARGDIIDPETKQGSWKTKDEILNDPGFFNHHRYFFEQYLSGRPETGAGVLVNSAEFNGMGSEEAKQAIIEKVGGTPARTYRLRDWSVGRQRYWGVPIPMVYDPDGNPHPIPQEHLPWVLPEDVDPTPTGEPPLAKSKELLKRTEDVFGPGWKPEVETMDTFLDSSWYFLRYIDNEDQDSFSTHERQKEWMPVDIYFGGAEHTTMHLLYSRFWQKALFDLGHVTDVEPYQKRINRGLILGPDGNKMSKSKGNVIDPDEQVARVGADAVKMYLAFMGPYQGTNYPWDMGGIAGIRRFLERVHGLNEHIGGTEPEAVTRQLHKTIAKIAADITEYKFNTAISAMMIFVNMAEKQGLTRDSYETFLTVLAPFAPHLAEELWHQAGKETSIHLEPWPTADPSLTADETVTIGVQINGKVRGSITIPPDAPEEDALAALQQDATLADRIPESGPERTIYVPGRILNIIVKEH